MVNTGTTTTTILLPSEQPEISLVFNTFTTLDPLSLFPPETPTGGRFISFELSVTGVKLPFAVNTFQRLFVYIQNLANNDVNPVIAVNTVGIPNTVGARGTTPKAACIIQVVDKIEITPTVNLTLSSENLRLDYMDEYFDRTLTYLTEVISLDLNPNE